jgi:hypothetical protein
VEESQGCGEDDALREREITMSKNAINVFWDNSNIWLVGKAVCAKKEPGDEFGFRIHLANLFNYVCRDRDTNYAYVSGSVPPPSDGIWKRFQALRIKVEKQQRGLDGKEVAVDEAIQLAIANRIIDLLPKTETIVLLTGDGAGFSQGRGFIAALERAIKMGFNIEVVSWDAGVNRNLKQFAQTNGIYTSLEPGYENITFINNKRWAIPI